MVVGPVGSGKVMSIKSRERAAYVNFKMFVVLMVLLIFTIWM